jgi:hypothetical protein
MFSTLIIVVAECLLFVVLQSDTVPAIARFIKANPSGVDGRVSAAFARCCEIDFNGPE